MRISSFERSFSCPQSRRPAPTDPVIETDDKVARVGSAIHDGIACYLMNSAFPDVRDCCKRWEVMDEMEDVRMMVTIGINLWDQHLSKHFPSVVCEQEVRSEVLGQVVGEPVIGHIDALGFPKDGAASIADFKSGWGDLDHWQNMRGYALAVMEEYGVSHVYATVAHLRHNTVDTQWFNREELEQWARGDFARRVVGQAGSFFPGAACRFCQRGHSCDARRAMIGSSVVALTTGGSPVEVDVFAMLSDPARRAEAGPFVAAYLDKVTEVEAAIERAKEELKRNVHQFGPIPVDETRALALVEVQRGSLDYDSAVPVLRELGLEDNEIVPSLRLTMGDTMDAIAKKAGRGEGKRAREDATAALLKAGALTYSVSHQLKRVRRADIG